MAVYWQNRIMQSEYGPVPIRLTSTHEQRLCDAALLTTVMPGARLQDVVAPPIPAIERFRPRFGYDDSQPGIRDVLMEDRIAAAYPNDWSGSLGSYSGSSVNTGYNPMG